MKDKLILILGTIGQIPEVIAEDGHDRELLIDRYYMDDNLGEASL